MIRSLSSESKLQGFVSRGVSWSFQIGVVSFSLASTPQSLTNKLWVIYQATREASGCQHLSTINQADSPAVSTTARHGSPWTNGEGCTAPTSLHHLHRRCISVGEDLSARKLVPDDLLKLRKSLAWPKNLQFFQPLKTNLALHMVCWSLPTWLSSRFRLSLAWPRHNLARDPKDTEAASMMSS